MRYFFGTVLVGIIVVAGLVYYVDPAYRWRDAPKPFVRALSVEEARICPRNFDERTVKISQLKLIEKPEVVLLGSSRVAGVGQEFFNLKHRIFNAGMSESIIEDYTAIWQFLKLSGKIPEKIIIFTDPWIFNSRANSNLTGWQKIKEYVDSFYKGKQTFVRSKNLLSPRQERTSVSSWLKERVRRLNRLVQDIDDTKELLSWPMVKETGRVLWTLGLVNDRVKNRIVSVRDLRSDDRALLADGSTRYSEAEDAPKSRDHLEGLVREYLSGHNFLEDWEFDPSAPQKLNTLLRDMAAHDVQVLMVSPPFHPLVERNLFESPTNAQKMREADQALSESTQGLPQISFCNAGRFDRVGCEESEMRDGTHMLKGCIRKVLNYCLKGPFWGQLTP